MSPYEEPICYKYYVNSLLLRTFIMFKNFAFQFSKPSALKSRQCKRYSTLNIKCLYRFAKFDIGWKSIQLSTKAIRHLFVKKNQALCYFGVLETHGNINTDTSKMFSAPYKSSYSTSIPFFAHAYSMLRSSFWPFTKKIERLGALLEFATQIYVRRINSKFFCLWIWQFFTAQCDLPILRSWLVKIQKPDEKFPDFAFNEFYFTPFINVMALSTLLGVVLVAIW